MKNIIVTTGWVIVSILFMAWVSYQTWSWFFKEKYPLRSVYTVSSSHAVEVKDQVPLRVEPFQNEGNLVQRTINGNQLQ